MRIGKLLLITCMFLALSSDAFASFETASEFRSECSRISEDLLADLAVRTYCIAYVDGIIDATVFLLGVANVDNFICLPKTGIPPTKALNITFDYLKDNSDLLPESPRLAVILALFDYYPCQN